MPAPIDDFIQHCEIFFVERVGAGLAITGAFALMENERDLLLMPMQRLRDQSNLRKRAKPLLESCVEALESAHARETEGRGAASAGAETVWRENNKALYHESRRVISCVVQKWYLSRLHEQMRRDARPRSRVVLYTWYSPGASQVWDYLLAPQPAAAPGVVTEG
jgi:hypothetical protein